MEGVKGKKCPVFILPLALESRGGGGTPAAALGRRSGGSRAAGIMGKRVMGPGGSIPFSNFGEGACRTGSSGHGRGGRTAALGGVSRAARDGLAG